MSKFSSFLHIIERVAPAVLALVPGIPVGVAQHAATVIAEAQQIEGASGADKKQHVMNAVAAAGASADELAALSAGIDTTINVIKVVDANHGHQLNAANVASGTTSPE